jgi:hypothetical protein
MYVDPYAYHALLAVDLLAATICGALAYTILRGKRVGGLTFCKLGRLGFCFYVTKTAQSLASSNVPSPTTTVRSLPVVEG